MKHIKVLMVLVPVLVLITISQASAFYEPLDIMIYHNYNENGDDHPWGGDESPGDDTNISKLGQFDLVNTPLFFIEIIRVIYAPQFNYQPILENRDSGTSDQGILPDSFDGRNRDTGRRGN